MKTGKKVALDPGALEQDARETVLTPGATPAREDAARFFYSPRS
jgi:hypothetical protein